MPKINAYRAYWSRCPTVDTLVAAYLGYGDKGGDKEVRDGGDLVAMLQSESGGINRGGVG